MENPIKMDDLGVPVFFSPLDIPKKSTDAFQSLQPINIAQEEPVTCAAWGRLLEGGGGVFLKDETKNPMQTGHFL